MPESLIAKPPLPLFLRILIRAWLGFQALLFLAIVTTHGAGMEPDLRLLSGAAMVFASFPLSLLTMYASLVSLEKLSVDGLLLNALVNWTGCFLAGALQLWLITALVKRLRAARARAADA